MARQFWNLWGDGLRQSGVGMPPAPGLPDWQQGAGGWSPWMANNRPPMNEALDIFQRQAGDWYGRMQQVAARFAGQPHSASEVGQAWREAMGAQGDATGFAEAFRAMLSPGRGQGMDGWMEQAKPWLEALQRESARWLHAPAFGLNREHQERWQALALAQQEHQQQSNAFNGLMLQTAQRAFDIFEQKLEQHAQPGQQVTSARGLFDIWIDAAEQSYGEIAMSDEFRHVYGAMTNAQMRLRLGMQREIEQVSNLFGMPTRTEVDSAHRKIVELERQLRKQQVRAITPIAGKIPTAGIVPPQARKKATTAVRAPAKRKQTVAAAVAVAAGQTKRKAAATTQQPGKAKARPGKTTVAPIPKTAPKSAARNKKGASTANLSMKDWITRSRSAVATPAPVSSSRPASKGKR